MIESHFRLSILFIPERELIPFDSVLFPVHPERLISKKPLQSHGIQGIKLNYFNIFYELNQEYGSYLPSHPGVDDLK
jgi:hypothetical protein